MFYLFGLGISMFMLGFFGIFVTTKHFIMLLMALEVVLISLNLITILLSLMYNDAYMHMFFLIILTIAASESALGLSLIVIYYRLKGSLNINLVNLLKG
jgi:NADH-quinone oxidoreductase subunit K